MINKIKVSYNIKFKKHAGTVLVIHEKKNIISNKFYRTFLYISPPVLHLFTSYKLF